ncbi:hypothetical protein PACTADRAFT_185689 [Pachysolen tannophilus NRRL Y-2460]|uniref:Proline dehydrogenase n=1 Tax=Pachysolen tannophilus NRRL Y-2460 TaxID=669874 RepID=A0A1E4U1T4_PACTA|nr:hypothetical protein PACTADRAFT_185689 [Pachysolen tannophilus NRRL Y-2460]
MWFQLDVFSQMGLANSRMFPYRLDANNILLQIRRILYLESLSNKELFSYGVIGLATLNKPILDFVVKLFPYVPMFLVKTLVYDIYCGGQNIEQVMETGNRLNDRGIKNMMISLTIEACNGNDNVDVDYIVQETNRSVNEIAVPHTIKMIEQAALQQNSNINDIAPGYVALKPTGLVADAAKVLKNFQSEEYKNQFEKLVRNCSFICENVFQKNKELKAKYPTRVSPFVVAVLDAESYELQQGVYELQRRLFKKFNPINSPVSVVGTIQMYLKESLPLYEFEQKLAEKENYRIGLKLVRGAYIHSELDRSVIHDTKQDTDINYNTAVQQAITNILKSTLEKKSSIGHLVVASHNPHSQYLATKLLSETSNFEKSNVVLAQLLGMADNVTLDLINNHGVKNIIKYVPWGPPKETKEYLQRRLEENGDAVRADNGLPLVKSVLQILLNRFFGKTI